METEAQFQAEMIAENLTGWRILEPVLTPDADYDQRFGFKVGRRNETKIVWVDCDAESNAAGWLAIDDEKENDDGCK